MIKTTITPQFLWRSYAKPSPIFSSHRVQQKLLENYIEKVIENELKYSLYKILGFLLPNQSQLSTTYLIKCHPERQDLDTARAEMNAKMKFIQVKSVAATLKTIFTVPQLTSRNEQTSLATNSFITHYL